MRTIKDIFIKHYQFEDDNISLNKIDYPHTQTSEILKMIKRDNISAYDYVMKHEPHVIPYMNQVVDQMLTNVRVGLDNVGSINDKIHSKHLAKDLYFRSKNKKIQAEGDRLALIAYAYASSEQYLSTKVSGGISLDDSLAVLESLVYHYYYTLNYPKNKIVESLCVSTLLSMTNEASVSIDAVSIGSSFITYLDEQSIETVHYASTLGHQVMMDSNDVSDTLSHIGLSVIRCFDCALLAKEIIIIKQHHQ